MDVEAKVFQDDVYQLVLLKELYKVLEHFGVLEGCDEQCVGGTGLELLSRCLRFLVRR